MLQHFESLLAKTFKWKYFPHKDFLEATLGRRPSFVCRSMIASQQLLKEGLIWRIGDDRKIQFWKDKWIPRQHSLRVLSPIVQIEKDAKVAGLIDYDLMGWKVDMLNNLFSPQDVDLIKSIPISIGEREDKLVWHYKGWDLFR